MTIQITEIYTCENIITPDSVAPHHEPILYHSRRVVLAPKQENAGQLMAGANSRHLGAFKQNQNVEKHYRKMQSLIIEKARSVTGSMSEGEVTAAKKDAQLLARGVDALVKYYAEENVDFLKLPFQEQYVAAQHFVATPAAAVRNAFAPDPVAAIVIRDIAAPVPEPVIRAIPAATVKSDTSGRESSIESDLSDVQWDASVENLTKKALEFAGIDRHAYDALPAEQQDEIYAAAHKSFMKYAGLNHDEIASLAGQAYLKLVEKFAEPAIRNTAPALNAVHHTVEQTVTSISTPVVRKVTTKRRKPEVAPANQRNVHTIPVIYASGSNKPVKLTRSVHQGLINNYGDKSLKAELAMAAMPKTVR